MSLVVINSEESLQTFIGDMREQWKEHRYLRVTVKAGKDRSLDFNAQSHVWYEQVARELREDTALGVKNFCKLHFGVPILRAEDAEFRAFYNVAMLRTLSYEQKIAAMTYLPVTSLMTTKQFSAYMDAVQEHFALRVKLEYLEDPKK